MPISYSFLIALEVLADLDVGVFLKTAFIFDDPSAEVACLQG
jgi:hypothetical protein